jgi:hypothetical protein
MILGDGNVEIGLVKLLINKVNTVELLGLEGSVIFVT